MEIMCGYCRSGLILEEHLQLSSIFDGPDDVIICGACKRKMRVEITLHPHEEDRLFESVSQHREDSVDRLQSIR